MIPKKFKLTPNLMEFFKGIPFQLKKEIFIAFYEFINAWRNLILVLCSFQVNFH